MKAIKEEVSAELVEKKSKFIANIFYIETEQEAEEKINQIRKKYYDAKHVCFAFSVYLEGQIKTKANDDGEPSGTAGKPLLGIIEKNNLQNVLIVVTRYFGGILLGTGGLVKAYSSVAIEALKKAEIMQIEEGKELKIEISYNNNDQLKYYLNKNKIKIIDIEYSQNIIYRVEANNKKIEELYKLKESKIDNNIGNIISIVEICRKYVEKGE